QYPNRLILQHRAIHDIDDYLEQNQIAKIEGALFDLGVSSPQLDNPQRGFSFQNDGPLDMRMDPSDNYPTAAHLVNTLPEKDLANIIFQLGEERQSRKIARMIVQQRKQSPFHTTRQLAELLEKQTPPRRYKKKRGRNRPPRTQRLHPATRTFQALRIYVNQELEELRQGLKTVIPRLSLGGRIAVISFHSLEDRLVKRTFRHHAGMPPPPLPRPYPFNI
ncbi:16S rRNA (cytosine(1402)-N(4))-methyltransferase RsmH, partial [Magnetococcales bacterium HHB-1]